MDPDAAANVTQLLTDPSIAADERAQKLLPLMYEQLRAEAHRLMGGERTDHTLQPTALVHEAYLRLIGPRHLPWQNRAHFYTAAAEAMRRILIDHAKARGRLRRCWGTEPCSCSARSATKSERERERCRRGEGDTCGSWPHLKKCCQRDTGRRVGQVGPSSSVGSRERDPL